MRGDCGQTTAANNESGGKMRAADGGRRGLLRWKMQQEWAAGGRDSSFNLPQAMILAGFPKKDTTNETRR